MPSEGLRAIACDVPLHVLLGVFGCPVCFDKYDRASPLSDSVLTVFRALEPARWQSPTTPVARKKGLCQRTHLTELN